MPSRPLCSILAAFATGLCLQAVPSHGEVFDWNNVTYAPTTAQATTTTNLTNTAITDNSLSLKFTLNGAATFQPASTVQSPNSASNSQNTTYYSSGGLATTQKSLQMVVDFTSNADSTLVNIFFAKPVVSLSFSLFDVDSGTVTGSGAYQDRISAIQGLSTAGGTVTPSSLTNIGTGATNTIDSGTQATAISQSSAAQASNNGNINVAFSSTTPITQISFLYGDVVATGTAHSNVQLIALSNLTFTTVPEPGTTALLATGVMVAGVIAFRHRPRA